MTNRMLWNWLATSARCVAIAMLLSLVAAGALIRPSGAGAVPTDTITLTSPNNTTIAESDDYATQVLGDPWDMNNTEDVDYLDHMTPPSLGGGIWSSQSTTAPGAMFLQYPNWQDAMDYIGERSGPNYPIDSNRFRHLRFRMYSPVADSVRLFWYHNRNLAPAGLSGLIPTQTGWHVYDIDLAGLQVTGTAWTASNWEGFRLDPAYFSTNTTVQFDWARLTPATGSSVAITWSATGSTPVNLYLDSDQNSSNGTEYTIATNLAAASGNYSWNTVGIAPGRYFVRAVMGTASSYSGALVVNDAPVLDLTAPSPSSGEDYASARLGHPWTLTSLSHLAAWYNITNIAPNPAGYLQATATNNDPQLWLSNFNTPAPIDANRYHYLSYRLYLERRSSPTNGQYDQWNGGPRIIWSRNSAPLNWQTTQLVIGWYNRWIPIAVDLRTAPRAGGTEPWDGTETILRIDPHEDSGPNGAVPPFFRVGQVRLTADPTVANGNTTAITWVPGKNTGNVTLKYSTSPAGGGTTIATVPISQGGYNWTVSGLANGNYWITATASDGFNAFTQVSRVPLVVAGANPCPPMFSDVPTSHPFYPYISNLACRKIIEGYRDNTFQAGFDATRGQLAQWVVLARSWPIDTHGGPHFVDMPPTDPLYPYVETALNHLVFSGYADGTFRPYAQVTRGQMSKMIVNAFGWPIVTAGGPHFVDVTPSNAFYGQIETIWSRGLVSGYTCGGVNEPCPGTYFRWAANNTRGQLAKVLSNALGP